MTFTHHSDAAHGWLEVPAKELEALGLSAADFSRFSYVDEYGKFTGSGVSTLYLEEDCDAMQFIRAYERSHGIEPSINDGPRPRHDLSRIRNMPINTKGYDWRNPPKP